MTAGEGTTRRQSAPPRPSPVAADGREGAGDCHRARLVRLLAGMKLVAFFHLKEVRWSLHDSDPGRAGASAFRALEVVSVEDDAELPAALADAEVFVGWRLPPEHFRAAARLRWIHSASAGIDDCLFPALVESDVVLTNSTGLHAICIPEHVLGQMLVLARNFHEAQRLQQRGRVEPLRRHRLRRRRARAARQRASPSSAPGRSAPTWRAWRRRSACACACMRRDAGRPVPHAEAVVPPSALHELLGWARLRRPRRAAHRRDARSDRRRRAARHAVERLPDQHRARRGDRRGRRWCAACAPAASPARRSTSSRRSRCPPEHPFWALPNLVLTPHISGYTPTYFDQHAGDLRGQPGALPRGAAAAQRRRQAARLRARRQREA